MLLGYMTGFAGYLNDNGYEVTQDKISHFLSLKNEEIDFTKEEDILPLMKVCFCRNKKEAGTLHKPGALKRVVLGEDEGTLVHV